MPKKEDNKKVRIRRPKHNQSICLCMIVKDESHIIVECLENMKKYIDYWVICDTGSTDGTQKIIKDYFAKEGIPGELHEHRWQNFGYNRTLAFEECFEKTDYAFVMDADDLIVGDFNLPENMTADAYYLKLGKDFTYDRAQIFKNRKLKWEYVGVLHEYANCKNKKNAVFERIEGDYFLNSRREGARSKDPEKYLKDAEVLVKALNTAEYPLKVRYSFYAGQSYFDYGDYENAIIYYKMRIELGGWIEEIYYSYLRIGNALVKLNRDEKEISKAYLDGYRVCKERAETLFELGKYYAEKKKYTLAISYLKQAAGIPYPKNSKLFVMANIYRWEAKFLIAKVYHWSGKYEESYKACKDLLKTGEDMSEWVINNILTLMYLNVPQLMLEPSFKNYNTSLVKEITENLKKKKTNPNITFSITTCKRYDLFELTMNSFINCCKDISLIDKWICVDDNSSSEDRDKMKTNYPFFEYIMKGVDDKGHQKSMEIIRNKVKTPYLLHMEDDWYFFEKKDYIKPALEILNEKEIKLLEESVPDDIKHADIGQVLFNVNYTETHERLVSGGYHAMTKNDIPFVIHEYVDPDKESELYKKVTSKYPNGSCVYWPHYSFRPSLIKTEVFKVIGEYSKAGGFFEKEYAHRYTENNYISAFFESICCYHMGRKTWERNSDVKNAYTLNEENQFGINASNSSNKKKYTPVFEDYDFYPNLDSFCGDIGFVPNVSIEELKLVSDRDKRCKGFNTYGYLKYKICKKDELIYIGNKTNFPDGLYVKKNTIMGEDDLESKEPIKKQEKIVFVSKSNESKLELKEENENEIINPQEEKEKLMKDKFVFYANMDSPGYDIKDAKTQNIMELMKLCEKDKKCIGFNTYGYLKYKIRDEKQFTYFEDKYHDPDGLYIKKSYINMSDKEKEKLYEVDKSKYKFFKGMDIIGFDIEKVNMSLDDIMYYCEIKDDCVGFNTLGFIKNKIDLKNLKKSQWFGENDGVYVNMDKIEEKKNKKKQSENIYIKPLTNWVRHDFANYFKRFSKNNDNKWDNIVITDDESIADYYIVINKPIGNFYYDKNKTIVFQMEPQCGISTWGNWANPSRYEFLQVRTHEFYPNNNEWHIGKTYEQLLKDDIASMKTKLLSTVISNKVIDEGHIKRIDFIKFLETKEENMIDIYGRCRDLGFKNYIGELPFLDKTNGYYPYKYSFIAENNAEYNYFTEKIVDILVTECLCFYWGCPNLESYFPNAFIRLELKDFEHDYLVIKNAIKNNEYEKRLPYIKEAKKKILNELQIFPTIHKIFNTVNSNMFDTFFDKILVINKDDNKWSNMEKRLIRNNISKYERFIVKDNYCDNSINNIIYDYKRAHYDAINYAKRRGYHSILLIEDHVIIDKNKMGKLNLALADILERKINYDILYLSGKIEVGEQVSYYINKCQKSQIGISSCYAVNIRVYDEIIKSIDNNRQNNKLDICSYNENSYVVYPLLVYEDIYYSSLEKKNGKLYCLNLERRSDRKDAITKLFRERNIKHFNFYKAVDGKDLAPTEDLEKLFKNNDFGSRKAVIGCALSHYNMWKELLQTKYDYFLIMEDDIEIDIDYTNIIDKLVYDMYKFDSYWDIFYLGYSMFQHHLKPNTHVYRKSNKDITIHELNNDFYIGGFFGYLISRSGAEKLVSFIEQNGIKHGIDYLPKKYRKELDLHLYETRYHLIVTEWVSSQNSLVDTDIQKDFNRFDF
jgi:GR25 family glycosyltransferase involved in LPS biosynthesis